MTVHNHGSEDGPGLACRESLVGGRLRGACLDRRTVKPEYEPQTIAQMLGYLVEECGEVMAAVGKAQRWGLASSNPELPEDQRETNGDWILREMDDLEGAILRLRAALTGAEPLPRA